MIQNENGLIERSNEGIIDPLLRIFYRGGPGDGGLLIGRRDRVYQLGLFVQRYFFSWIKTYAEYGEAGTENSLNGNNPSLLGGLSIEKWDRLTLSIERLSIGQNSSAGSTASFSTNLPALDLGQILAGDDHWLVSALWNPEGDLWSLGLTCLRSSHSEALLLARVQRNLSDHQSVDLQHLQVQKNGGPFGQIPADSLTTLSWRYSF